VIGIPIGLFVANAGEWWIHKHILHGLGKDRESFWSFHWHDHHAKARKHEMVDDQYTSTIFAWEPQTKELVALGALMASHVPLFPLMPFYVGTLWYSAIKYYRVHKASHLDEEWAKEHLPWHYDHHMGKDQNANWCVTNPFFDHLMGTRKRYLYGQGVPQELPESNSVSTRLLDALRGELTRLQKRGEPERIGGTVEPQQAA
jgi:Fatty acid hydroxylase superfamily